MGNSCSPGCRWWCLSLRLFVLSFFPRDVLDESWGLFSQFLGDFILSLSLWCLGRALGSDSASSYSPTKLDQLAAVCLVQLQGHVWWWGAVSHKISFSGSRADYHSESCYFPAVPWDDYGHEMSLQQQDVSENKSWCVPLIAEITFKKRSMGHTSKFRLFEYHQWPWHDLVMKTRDKLTIFF